jgi:hypothetical protein
MKEIKKEEKEKENNKNNKKEKSSHWGLVLNNTTRRGSYLGGVGPFGVGYIGVEELGGGYHPACKEEGDLGGKQKNEQLWLGFRRAVRNGSGGRCVQVGWGCVQGGGDGGVVRL